MTAVGGTQSQALLSARHREDRDSVETEFDLASEMHRLVVSPFRVGLRLCASCLELLKAIYKRLEAYIAPYPSV